MLDPTFLECQTALEIAAAGGDPCDSAPADRERRQAWEEVILPALRPAVYGAADWAIAVANQAAAAGDMRAADAARALVRASHYERVRAALALAGLPTPEPRADAVAAYRAHYERHGWD